MLAHSRHHDRSGLLLSYVPRHVAQDLLLHPTGSPVGRVQRFDAVALYADISGFTAMSEALGRTGTLGTEELTRILNGYFEPMVELVHSYGGVVGKFGGDAMSVLFPMTPRTRPAVVRRAVQCAIEMQAAMPRYRAIPTNVGVFDLEMKAGLALGPVLCTTVGNPAIRLEHVVAGRALDLCAEAEHRAKSGEVVVHDDLLGWCEGAQVAEAGGSFSRVARLSRRARRAPLSPLEELPEPVLATLGSYLHPTIAELLESGHAGFVNEHRKVAVLFVGFEGFDYDRDPEAAPKLQAYLSAVIEAVHRYDGYLRQVEMGDKGSKCIVLFGAPVAHENDEDRAVRCALELSELSGSSARIGVVTGFVYCGQVGSEARKEYAVVGDAANLSARLMEAAEAGQILVGGPPSRPLTDAFALEPLEPITVKGKDAPVSVHSVRGVAEAQKLAAPRLDEPSYTLPMVGREAELQLAGERIQRVLERRGQVIGIAAEAGMGKSRLSAEVVKLAADHGFAGYAGACQAYGAGSSYFVWRGIWRSFFQVEPAQPLSSQVGALETHLSSLDSALVERLPLLAAALNIPIPDNELTASLDPELRTDLLRSLLLTCLRRRAETSPVVLVLEDCQWIDALSQELLAFIGRNIGDLPVLLVVLYRGPDPKSDPVDWARPLDHFNEIALEPLLSEEAEALLGLKSERLFGEAEAVPAGVVEWIAERAEGNPFYLEEMVHLIHDRGVDPRDAEAVKRLDLPDTLYGLIAARIDQLSEGERITLKVASVLGRLVKASWLWGSYPEIGTPAVVKQRLDALSRLDLTPLARSEPELEYLFKHVTTREVAYDSLTFALRETLHERVGQFIETTFADTLAQHVDLLAYHFGRSANVEKQRMYFRQAGDEAKAAYANQAAIDYYRRLLPILSEAEQWEVLRSLGEVHQLIGEWTEADETYRQALALAEVTADAEARAECQSALGHLLCYTRSYEEALSLLERAKAGFEAAGGDASGLSRTLEYLALTYFRQSDYVAALAYAEQHLRLAEELGDKAAVSMAAETIGLVSWHQHDYVRALAAFQQSLDLATEIGHKRAVIHANNDLAGLYWEQGDYARAFACLLEALNTAVSMGYQTAVATVVGNAGELCREQGDYARALACFRREFDMAVELGDWTTMLHAVGNTAIVLAAQEQSLEAERLYASAVALARALGNSYFLSAYLHYHADLHADEARYAEALEANEEALSIAKEIEYRDIQFRARVLSNRLRVLLGEIDSKTAVEKVERLAREWTEAAEQAALRYELWTLNPRDERSRRTSAHLYRELYAKTPRIEYRDRYEGLTGDRLPDPPALPPLPESAGLEAVDLEDLPERVERVIQGAAFRQEVVGA